MANLAPISTATTAATALSNLILVTPQSTVGYQPQNAPTIDNNTRALPPSLIFQYEGEQNLYLQSDITDHYIEDNTAINDMIALHPEEYSTTGYIGELNDVAPQALVPLKFLADKLTTVSAYVPSISETALIAYNEAFFAYQIAQNAINNAVSSWSTITGSDTESVIDGNGITIAKNQTKQQIMFQQFYGYWRNRTLFTIQTPWAIFRDMAIKSLRAIQSADTRMITDFEVTFKIMRFAKSISVSRDITKQNRASTQGEALTNQGQSVLSPSSLSFPEQTATMTNGTGLPAVTSVV